MTNCRSVPALGNEAQDILDCAISDGHTLMIGPERDDGIVKIYKRIVVAIGFDRHRHIMTASLLSVIKWDRARAQSEREERERVRNWAMGVQDPDHNTDEPLDGLAARAGTPEERPDEVETWPRAAEEQSQEVEEQSQGVGQQLEGNKGASEDVEDSLLEMTNPSSDSFLTPATTQPTSQEASDTTTAARRGGLKRVHEHETTAASKRSKRTAGEKPHLLTWHERWWQEEARMKKEKK